MEMSQGELFIGQGPLRVPDRGIDARQVLQAREAVLAVPRAAQRGMFYAFDLGFQKKYTLTKEVSIGWHETAGHWHECRGKRLLFYLGMAIAL